MVSTTTKLTAMNVESESPLLNSLHGHLVSYYDVGLPSEEDLDKVMEEEKIREVTSGVKQ